MFTQHSPILDLEIVPTSTELQDQDLEQVSGKLAGFGTFSRYAGFVGNFPSFNIPNFFGS